MALRRLLTQVSRQQLNSLFPRSYFTFQRFGGNRLLGAQERLQSSYVGSLARRVRDTDGPNDAAYLKELYRRNDPEAVIRLFESQPSLHSSPSALVEYVKALVKVDRLDESELFKTLHRGGYGKGTAFEVS
ncbi:hypothetical protein CsSME_00049399 [Camellia sinensis var. sinensis]